MTTRRTTPQHKMLRGPRGPVGYEVWGGARPPLLLIAGLGSRTTLWGELPRLLSEHFTVLTYDHRGVGRSRGGSPFTLTASAEDAAAVLAAEGHERAAVLGVSMGGLVACQLAFRFPSRVRRLVVASSAARLTPHGQLVLEFFSTIFRLPPEDGAKALMAFAFSPQFVDRFPGFVDTAARLYTLPPEDLPGAKAQLEHLLQGWDLRPILAHISCPTLVIAGESDPLVAPVYTRELAEGLPHARFRLVPAAAHSVLAEGGSELLREVIDFCLSP
ncbi:MAG: alpha/beta hydrolase [Thermoanaerobaculum sp.]|nr:alpha/beta hydrolase [Thermoanaerobaculum sp.]MCX7895317.1 alpha/beta hydrolase [Thermoanaerobaculum sp.]MDW7968411.1 alpha/beta hydrolase [Thermoanaerobaculum sp.]